MATKFRNIENVQNGDLLAQNITDSNGNILIKENTRLTKFMINKLKSLGYGSITVKDNIEDKYDADRFIDQQLVLNTVEYLKKMDIDDVYENAKELVKKVMSVKQILFENHGVWMKNNEFYHNQLAITEFSLLVGKMLNFNTQELLDLSVASLLHKMGTLCMFDENFKKINIPKTFSDRAIDKEEYKNALKEYNPNYYPLYSLGLIADNTQISSTAKMAIVMHRENIPFSFDEGEIQSDIKPLLNINLNKNSSAYIFSRIIHIVDCYESIITTKINGEYLTKEDALEYIYVVNNNVDALIVNTIKKSFELDNKDEIKKTR